MRGVCARVFDVFVCAGFLGGDGKDLCEANVGRVEAVCLVDLGESLVSWFGKDDVDALRTIVSLKLLESVLKMYAPNTGQRRGWRAQQSEWLPCRQPLPSCSWVEALEEGRWFQGRGC